MTPAELAAAVLDTARTVVAARGLDVAALPTTAILERPRNPEHGDYASTIAMQAARAVGAKPRDLAAWIAEDLRKMSGISEVDVAGPGFLNIRLDPAAAGALAATIVDLGAAYGRGDTLAGRKINLEFVSANPTGPLHIGAVRWAAVGDALARLLTTTGAQVTREYYFNDAGSQIDRFAASLYAAANGQPTPDDGYAGEYIQEIAASVGRDADLETFRRAGVALMFDEIKQSLDRFGVHFDVYFNEETLHQRNELDLALERLRGGGLVYDKDGAVWLRTTDFGDDKDRVLLRGDGRPTYLLADAAYYLDKRERGFDPCIMMLGADHHGYVNRLRAIAAAFGDDPDRTLEVLIGQMVNLTRHGEPVRMSKRAGTVVTIDDLVDAIGVDAARYALARYSTDSPIDLDLDLWARRTQDNPVYYVQYAHARIASLLRNAADLGIDRGTSFDPGLLAHDRERDLLGALGEFPAVVNAAADLREPHRVARYLEEVAGTYHRFYDACRVLPTADQPATDLTRARLWLVEASRIVLANGLGLLGVTAPERM